MSRTGGSSGAFLENEHGHPPPIAVSCAMPLDTGSALLGH